MVKLQSEIAIIPGMVHYLQHKPAVQQDTETTKVRVVFNTSLSFKETPTCISVQTFYLAQLVSCLNFL